MSLDIDTRFGLDLGADCALHHGFCLRSLLKLRRACDGGKRTGRQQRPSNWRASARHTRGVLHRPHAIRHVGGHQQYCCARRLRSRRRSLRRRMPLRQGRQARKPCMWFGQSIGPLPVRARQRSRVKAEARRGRLPTSAERGRCLGQQAAEKTWQSRPRAARAPATSRTRGDVMPGGPMRRARDGDGDGRRAGSAPGGGARAAGRRGWAWPSCPRGGAGPGGGGGGGGRRAAAAAAAKRIAARRRSARAPPPSAVGTCTW